MSWNFWSWFLCIQLLGTGDRYGAVQIPYGICDDQNFPGMVSGQTHVCGPDEWSVCVPCLEDYTASFVHSGILLRRNADLYGYGWRLWNVLHHHGSVFIPNTSLYHIQRHLFFSGEV